VKVVIVGCSRLGARLADSLDRESHSVTIIDVDSTAFRRLNSSFSGSTVIGTGIDEDILMTAGTDTADVFIAATNGDNRNIMAAQLAKHAFNVNLVLCRIYDPVRAETYRSLGIETICPTVQVANLFLQAITAETAKVE
jgi:trk system potassium uptake protein TrkA